MPQEIARAFLGNRGGPRRSRVFFLLGGLALLTFCLFASHLHGLQQFTSGRPFGGLTGNAGSKSGMTSSGHDPALTAPRHASTATNTPGAAVADPVDSQTPTKITKPEDGQQSFKMEYGANKHPSFKDDPPQLIRDLAREHIPYYAPPPPTEEPTDGEGKTSAKRLVVVGDVHGHLAALKALLRRIGFDHKHGDHLILAGDMVTKGPNSKGVVKLAMNLSASAVRGNQDDEVLAVARRMGRVSVDDEGGDDEQEADDADEDGQDDDDGSEAETETKRKYRHVRRVARSLSRAQLAWLRSLPIILRIGQLPNATSPPWNTSTITVVHGGLVPGMPLEKQDPWAVMNMRSLLYPGHGKGKGKHHNARPESEDDDEVAPDAVAVPIDKHDGEPWSHAWNRYQNNLPPSADHTVVIYGHDAKKGLQVTPQADVSPYSSSSTTTPSSSKKNHKKHKKVKGLRYAFGLDSGCGHGRQLTALIMEAGPHGVRHRIEQVECDLETEERALWGDQDYTPPIPPPPPEEEEEDGEEENQRVVG